MSAHHMDIIESVKITCTLNPEDLLAQHSSFLSISYVQLGLGSNIDMQVWLADDKPAQYAISIMKSLGTHVTQ